MNNVYFIGTLHGGLTDHRQLQDVLEEYQPDQLLVEIIDDDLGNEAIKKYPDEMQFAYNWAKNNDITCRGFDVDIDVRKSGVSKEDEDRVIAEEDEILDGYSWKDANRSEITALLKPYSDKVTDKIK